MRINRLLLIIIYLFSEMAIDGTQEKIKKKKQKQK